MFQGGDEVSKTLCAGFDSLGLCLFNLFRRIFDVGTLDLLFATSDHHNFRDRVICLVFVLGVGDGYLNFATTAIDGQKKRAEFERKIWKQLIEMAEAEDIHGFYLLYSEYLENSGVVSSSRKAILKMAKLVVRLTEVQ